MVRKFRDEFEQVIAEAALASVPVTGGNGNGAPVEVPAFAEMLERDPLQGRPVPATEQRLAGEVGDAEE